MSVCGKGPGSLCVGGKGLCRRDLSLEYGRKPLSRRHGLPLDRPGMHWRHAIHESSTQMGNLAGPNSGVCLQRAAIIYSLKGAEYESENSSIRLRSNCLHRCPDVRSGGPWQDRLCR